VPTKAKIKIDDIPELRAALDAIYETKTQTQLAQWALKLAEHALSLAGYVYQDDPVIQEGFAVNRLWQSGKARMFDVRQAGFKVHQLAKSCNDPVVEAALRVAGQAVGTGHMREHAMVASDYAIKTVNLIYPNDMDRVMAERQWQIASLQDDCGRPQ
jgi:hypothetical protein